MFSFKPPRDAARGGYKKILVVRLNQNAKTHVLCYNADLLSSPSPNPQGLASTKTQLVPRGLGLKLLTKSNKITCSTLLRKGSYPSKYSQCALWSVEKGDT